MKYHFASIETNDNLYLLDKVKPLYVLASYFYLKKLKDEQLKEFFNYVNSSTCKQFILDSGAFTYIMGSKKQKDFIMNNTFWVGVYPGMSDSMIDYMAKVIIEAVK